MNTKEFRKTLKLIKEKHGDNLPIFIYTDHGQNFERLTDFEVGYYYQYDDGEIDMYSEQEANDEDDYNLKKCIVLYGN